MNDKETPSRFFDTSFRVRAVYYFVPSADGVSLLAKSTESVKIYYIFKWEIDSNKFSAIEMLF